MSHANSERVRARRRRSPIRRTEAGVMILKKAPASLPGLRVVLKSLGLAPLDAANSIPKHTSHQWLSKKCQSCPKKCRSNHLSSKKCELTKLLSSDGVILVAARHSN